MKLKIILNDNTDFIINETSLISWNYKADSTDNNEILLGYASSCSLTFSLKNINNAYTNTDFTDCKVELWNDDLTVRKGIFNYRTLQKRDEIFNFSCLDNMIKFDKRFIDETFTGTVADFLQLACNDCVVSAGDSLNSFLNDDLTITNIDTIINMNYREIIQAIAECCGIFFYIDKDGKLQQAWYNTTHSLTIPYTSLHSLEIQEEVNSPKEITGVINGVEVKSWAVLPDGYALYLSNNNPIFMNHTEADITNRIIAIKSNRLNNFNYYTASFSLRIDWSLNIGDSVRVQDKYGNYYLCLITNLTYNNYMMSINSAGQNYNRDYNQITNKDAERKSSGVLLYRSNKDTDGIYSYTIKNIKESSQVYLNVSDTNLNGSIDILIEGTLYKTITSSGGLSSYGVILDLENTMTENEIQIDVNGITDLEISFMLINCDIEETVIEETMINRDNVYDTLLLNIEEIQGGE